MAHKVIHQEFEKNIKLLTAEILKSQNAVENLRKSETQKNAFLDSITTSLIFVNANLEIQWANSAAAESVNTTVDAMIGQSCFRLRAQSDKPCTGCPTLKTFKTGKTQQLIMNTPDGRVWDEKSEPVFDEKGEIIGALEIAHDVTEKTRMEKQLRQIQNMNAVAGLAGGIAHQFNNALVGIIGNIELLQIALPAEKKTNKYINSIKQSVNRMASLTSQLLAYARGGKYQIQRLSFDALVKSVLEDFFSDVNPKVKIKSDFSENEHYVKVDPTQIQMVIMAIISNAVEAIDTKGWIKVGIHTESISREVADNNPAIKSGRFACFSVEDNGKGMAPEILKRVFEPFFTTNFQGRGLSMAAVYGIVENHDGWIAIGSEPGKGTVVKIYLPILDTLALKKDVIGAGTVGGKRTVLLIEDDEMMMDINRTMLQTIGYHVLSARGGVEAIMIAYTYKEKIDLALLDTGLPDKEGKEVFLGLKRARPELNIIILDHHSKIDSHHELLDVGAHNFLAKPFTISQLKEMLAGLPENGVS